MAKATKTKKEKPVKPTAVVEHSGITETVPISEDGVIEITPLIPIIKEPEIGDEPPSVTLDEVEEVKEPAIHSIKVGDSVYSTDGINPVLKDGKPLDMGYLPPLPNEELPMEEKIIKFIESRSAGEIRMNDFLKSLFGVPKFGEPAKWLSQAASKELKVVLNKLSNEGQIAIVSNAHMKLGTFHYPDTSTMKTQYHNLNSVQIIAIKRN